MILICSAFAGLRRNNCFFNRRLRLSRQAARTEEGVTVASSNYNSPPFAFMYNVCSSRLDVIAPELIYGSEESFLKQEPQLKELLTKRYLAKQLPKQEEADILLNCMGTTTLKLDEVVRSSSSREKSVLEEELSHETIYEQDKDILEPDSDQISEESEENALLAFRELLKSQSVCVICLEDFEKGCYVRILSCTHLFHSVCLRQWLTKSVSCPLCKRHLFRESDSAQRTGRCGYRPLVNASSIFNNSHFLTRNSPEWFHIERLEYQMRGQSWQNRNALTAFI